ncbi:hypothetical protein [Quadrisphaera sp. INWT6]|uniref:hypothetical protein n=1 Tax=Quadrisphaera sp. INWT6 TaxID=2596917 RepID=UPI0018922EFE|nr:hypothetical protein [Quadrisphaera sp. INWT6]MBF5081191.1 hypothetical protein [Quadrisphaera sp. INWT6]
MTTAWPAACDSTGVGPERAAALRASLDDIADRVLRIGLLGGGLVAQLPEASRSTALRHLEELDAVTASLRAVIVQLSSPDGGGAR